MRETPDSRDCPTPKKDIAFTALPELSWDKTNAGESARRLADYVSCEAQLAIRWYLDRKVSLKNWAQSFRVTAIIATAAAGLIPLLSEVLRGLPAIWGSVAIIIAATAVGLDRFFGFSSAWMRCLTTEMQIRQALHRFLLEREAKQAKLAGTAPDERTTEVLVQRCRDFIDEVNQILKDETDEWVNEFRQNLADIDRAAKSQRRELRLGALNVVVTNGDECEDGWDLSIDDRAPGRHQGRTAASRGLTAGTHALKVSGVVSGKSVHTEAAFIVAEGRTAELSLTLA